MIVLDENFPETQRRLLQSWRVPVRQIGLDLGRAGMKDDEIIPLLRRTPRPTFFSLDHDFYVRTLADRRYCLVTVAFSDEVAASFVRRLLRHREFNTSAKRLGNVLKVTSAGVYCWRLQVEHDTHIPW